MQEPAALDLIGRRRNQFRQAVYWGRAFWPTAGNVYRPPNRQGGRKHVMSWPRKALQMLLWRRPFQRCRLHCRRQAAPASTGLIYFAP